MPLPTLQAQASFPSTFPIELLQLIIQELPQGELWNVCALSCAFHQEVVRELFRHVDLANCTSDQLVSWTSLIASRPDRAQLTRALSLPWGLGHTHFEEENPYQLREQLPSALKALVNLTSLFIVRCSARVSRTSMWRSLESDHILGGCTFRLKTFRNDFNYPPWDLDNLLAFLLEQDQIEDLEIDLGDLTPALSNINLLPHLSILSTNHTFTSAGLFEVMAPRHLTRLKLKMVAGNFDGPVDFLGSLMNVIRLLAPASTTLTHFYHYSEMDAVHELHVDALETIGRGLPNLKFLCYKRNFVLNVSIRV